MKLREIFRFEFAYQLRRLSTWLLFAVLVVFAFLNTRDDSVAEALYAFALPIARRGATGGGAGDMGISTAIRG